MIFLICKNVPENYPFCSALDELRGIIGKESPGPASAEPGSVAEAIRGRRPSDFNPLPPPPVAL
jgi:hypothetical protein